MKRRWTAWMRVGLVVAGVFLIQSYSELAFGQGASSGELALCGHAHSSCQDSCNESASFPDA
jgi:hypothetical protein